MKGSERGTWAGPGRSSGFGAFAFAFVFVFGGVGRGGRGDRGVGAAAADKRDHWGRRFDNNLRTCER